MITLKSLSSSLTFNTLHPISSGVHPPKRMMHSPYFRYPLFQKIFESLGNICPVLPFPKKFPCFIHQSVLVSYSKFRISFLVSQNFYISPYFGKHFAPPVFVKFTCSFTSFKLTCISPYFLP